MIELTESSSASRFFHAHRFHKDKHAKMRCGTHAQTHALAHGKKVQMKMIILMGVSQQPMLAVTSHLSTTIIIVYQQCSLNYFTYTSYENTCGIMVKSVNLVSEGGGQNNIKMCIQYIYQRMIKLVKIYLNQNRAFHINGSTTKSRYAM